MVDIISVTLFLLANQFLILRLINKVIPCIPYLHVYISGSLHQYMRFLWQLYCHGNLFITSIELEEKFHQAQGA